MDPEELGLWLTYKADPTTALREQLILRYAPLVKYVAGRMAVGMPSSVDRGDLTSYGMFGLLDAIEKFDVATGFKFETYAVRRVRGAIIDELRSMDWVPRSVRRKARDIERALAKLQSQMHRAPSDEELAFELGISGEQLADNLTQVSLTSVAALDGALGSSDGSTLTMVDTVVDHDAMSPDEMLDRRVLGELLRDAVDRLTEREQTVLALYYGEGMTLAQAGEVLGVTESRVCQIHSKAILALRSKLERDTAG
ncbi:MAG: RNA polymerase sigma factor for flagellar operon FliA [Myxococcota bacterium]|jgi:RNA polymerase sigma factor for flagellar operon FliA